MFKDDLTGDSNMGYFPPYDICQVAMSGRKQRAGVLQLPKLDAKRLSLECPQNVAEEAITTMEKKVL